MINVPMKFHDPKNCPTPSSHVIQLTETIFELNSRIKETNLLTKFHENWAKNVTFTVFTCFHYTMYTYREKCPAHWRPYINKTNVLTNFHDDREKIVTSRVFTRKTAPPTGGAIFKLGRDFIGTKLQNKFHEDGTRNVFSSKCLWTDGRTDIRRTKTGHKSSPEQSGQLKSIWE
ncbi:hypothetical protein DPMN_041453 [Dreissena polymorpha]|uniref:Uncharacterized protein n=1 Tax=Dreissena polymorpha TaxID=45954 RepID=A0A9D4HW79_DREPO|nr:hypothetical protein DPMN_041453 [Dreissena polymorpha]